MNLLYHFCVGAFLTSIIIIVMFSLMGLDIKIMGVWGILIGIGLLISKKSNKRNKADSK